MEEITEPKSCGLCGRGHVEMHKDKIKIDGKPSDVCEECFDGFKWRE